MMRHFLIYSYDNYDGGDIKTEFREFGSADEAGLFLVELLAEFGVKSYTIIEGHVVASGPIE